jgi:hypothetical protein
MGKMSVQETAIHARKLERQVCLQLFYGKERSSRTRPGSPLNCAVRIERARSARRQILPCCIPEALPSAFGKTEVSRSGRKCAGNLHRWSQESKSGIPLIYDHRVTANTPRFIFSPMSVRKRAPTWSNRWSLGAKKHGLRSWWSINEERSIHSPTCIQANPN